MLHQIQNHALATQQRARVVANHGQYLAILHAHAVEDLWMADHFKARLRRGALVEMGENLQKAGNRAQAANHHLLPRNNRAGRAQARVDGEIGRGVAGGLIFNQRPLQQCVDAAALPVHGSFSRGQRST